MREMILEANQGVNIGDNIQVLVLEVRERSVRLGISYPRPNSPKIFDYHEETVVLEPGELEFEPALAGQYT